MEIKKAPEADLERGKALSLLLGLVVALSIFFVAIEWHSKASNEQYVSDALNIADIDDALIIEEQQEEELPPEPQVQQQVVEIQIPEDFKVVDNEKAVEKIVLVSVDEGKALPPPLPPGPAVVEPEDTEEIFVVVEENAEFPGGAGEMNKWLSKNIIYPEIAIDNNIQGRVIVTFVVERDGRATDVKVARGVDAALDKEAVRVVQSMPRWKPGMQRGKPVRSRFSLPVVFRLQQ